MKRIIADAADMAAFLLPITTIGLLLVIGGWT